MREIIVNRKRPDDAAKHADVSARKAMLG